MKTQKMLKLGIIATIKSIPDEQDTGITYFFGQELAEQKTSFEEYEEEVKKVTREDIVNFAPSVSIDTIYFLKKEEKAQK